MKATLAIENITNLATVSGDRKPKKNKEQKDIGLIENGVIAVSED
ncbi:imidazolonepropionase, partial [Vibrio parahaemolyticus]|nr:imidazolonepropionase [Vibrio parahaemolyticus]